MKTKSVLVLLLTLFFAHGCGTKSNRQIRKGDNLTVQLVSRESEKKVDIIIDGKLFTSYCWFDKVFKPILYPIFTSEGTEITRGFPLKTRAGERLNEHHQVGLWLNYGDVNGFDFWGNGNNGLKKANGGEIKHLKIERITGSAGEGVLTTEESWIDPSCKEILAEKTEYHFKGAGSIRVIDRITTLTATGDTVRMPDTKEGMFGIRVARQLELPSSDNDFLTDALGNPSLTKASSNEGVTGNYRSSEGVTGIQVWGTRARWMDLYGRIGNEIISIAICDHPKNQSYPTYWHARGYGLLSANPLGTKIFTKGKTELKFFIPAGKSTTFRYRVIINSGADLTNAQINAYADEFARKY